jgi:hypothetical protein
MKTTPVPFSPGRIQTGSDGGSQAFHQSDEKPTLLRPAMVCDNFGLVPTFEVEEAWPCESGCIF